VLVELALGSEHACARSDHGAIFCWGANEHGQIGNTVTAKQPTPTRVPEIGPAVQIAAGGRHSCAIDKDGAIFCWGSNDHGQIGDGTTENRSAPTKVIDAGPWAQVAAGKTMTCARKKSDKSVLCWGEMQPGGAVKSPMPVMGLSVADEIKIGQAHVCARATDGSVQCFGDNSERQLGVSKKSEKNIPVAVPEIQAAELALGSNHSCARTPSGEVFCWGGGLLCVPGKEQMGRIVAVKPAKVDGMDNIVHVAAGGGNVCGIITDGQIGCAVLSAQNKTCTTERVAPAALYGVRVLELGDGFACAILKGGLEAFCWGAGQSGQLGDGKMEDHKDPEPIKQPGEDEKADVPPLLPQDAVEKSAADGGD